VLTLSLQRMGMTPKLLAAAVRSCPAGMLQLNCIDRAELLDAVEHPEQHGDLVVRLYGYSARFVSLDGKMQEEFLTRAVL
jgi:pyruvate-formate lyase